MALRQEAPSLTPGGEGPEGSIKPAPEISIEQQFTATTAELVGPQAAAAMSLEEQWDMLSNMNPDDLE